MGVDDDFFIRDALRALCSAVVLGAAGSPEDRVFIAAAEGTQRETSRFNAVAEYVEDAARSTNNIRSAGDSQRPEQAKDRIRLDKATANIPGATATVKHIYEVRKFLGTAIRDLQMRGDSHDSSKLREPELSGFAQFTDMPRHGTPEYDARLKEMEPVLAEHYKNNDHHPEHYALNKDGSVAASAASGGGAIAVMPLPAMIEMLCDWRVRAGEPGKINWPYAVKRYGIGAQLESILRATADYYGF